MGCSCTVTFVAEANPVPGQIVVAIVPCPMHAAAADMLAALAAIKGTPEQQLAYLHERGLVAPDTRYDKGDHAQKPEAYELALIHEDDARGYFPAQLDLIAAVAKEAVARGGAA